MLKLLAIETISRAARSLLRRAMRSNNQDLLAKKAVVAIFSKLLGCGEEGDLFWQLISTIRFVFLKRALIDIRISRTTTEAI